MEFNPASVCGSASRQVESECNARRRAADGSPPLLWQSANAARDERADLRSGTGVVVRHTSDR